MIGLISLEETLGIMMKEEITNPFYDAGFAEAWANLRSSLGKDWRRFVLGYVLVVVFLAGAAMEHYFPEWLAFLW